MKRREFLAASAAATLGAMIASPLIAADADAKRTLIELRIYHFASPEKQQAFENFMGKAGIPAFNRAGVEPVGVFKFLAKDNPTLKPTTETTDVWLVLPFKSADAMIALEDRLAADADFQTAGKGILDDPQKDPTYSRYESTLLYAFPDFPNVQVPAKSADRIVQLRRYPSHNRERARMKQQMFNAGGEIEIFKRCGMNGVFFGEALVGPKMPSLTYMLAFENEDAEKKGWAAFRNDPAWKKLNADPTYKDTVIQPDILNQFLRPAAGSQI